MSAHDNVVVCVRRNAAICHHQKWCQARPVTRGGLENGGLNLRRSTAQRAEGCRLCE